MLTLYRFTGATCAAKVLLALSEKKIRFEDRLLQRDELKSAEYLKLNPNGVVPTITHDGETIIESSVILNYLEDAFDGASLRPADPRLRARMNAWLKLTDDALASLGTLTYAIVARQRFMAMPEPARRQYYETIPNLQDRASRRNAIELGLEAPEAGAAVKVLFDLQARAAAAAGTDGFLAGGYSLADAALTPFAHRMEALGLLAARSELPGFHRWWEAVQARPSFEEAITAHTPAALVEDIRRAAAANAPALRPLIEACRPAA